MPCVAHFRTVESYSFLRIRRASAQWRVRSWTLSFDISSFFHFHFFELFSKLLQSKPTQFRIVPKVLQSKPTQAAIFEQFFDFELQSTQTWTRIRATIRARVRIRTRIRARAIVTVEKRAREAASLGAIGHGDRVEFSSVGGSLF